MREARGELGGRGALPLLRGRAGATPPQSMGSGNNGQDTPLKGYKPPSKGRSPPQTGGVKARGEYFFEPGAGSAPLGTAGMLRLVRAQLFFRQNPFFFFFP